MCSTVMAHTRVTPRKNRDGEGDHAQWHKWVSVDTLAIPLQPECPAAQATTVVPTMEAVTMNSAVHPEPATYAPVM